MSLAPSGLLPPEVCGSAHEKVSHSCVSAIGTAVVVHRLRALQRAGTAGATAMLRLRQHYACCEQHRVECMCECASVCMCNCVMCKCENVSMFKRVHVYTYECVIVLLCYCVNL